MAARYQVGAMFAGVFIALFIFCATHFAGVNWTGVKLSQFLVLAAYFSTSVLTWGALCSKIPFYEWARFFWSKIILSIGLLPVAAYAFSPH